MERNRQRDGTEPGTNQDGARNDGKELNAERNGTHHAAERNGSKRKVEQNRNAELIGVWNGTAWVCGTEAGAERKPRNADRNRMEQNGTDTEHNGKLNGQRI